MHESKDVWQAFKDILRPRQHVFLLQKCILEQFLDVVRLPRCIHEIFQHNIFLLKNAAGALKNVLEKFKDVLEPLKNAVNCYHI